MHPQSQQLRRLVACAMLAAIYAVLTVLTASFSYGPIQFRMAEALCILPLLAPWCGWGLTLGCLMANLFSAVSALDLVFGTLATALTCFIISRHRRLWVAVAAPVICNGLLVGAMLAWVYLPHEMFFSGFAGFAAEVALSELAVMLALGLPLYWVLQKIVKK